MGQGLEMGGVGSDGPEEEQWTPSSEWRRKREVGVEHREPSQSMPNFSRARSAAESEGGGTEETERAGISHQREEKRKLTKKQTNRSMFGDSEFVEARYAWCKLSHILNLFCYCSFTPLDLN